MHCSSCSGSQMESCNRHGCAQRIDELHAGVVAAHERVAFDAQVSRLDVENGDILVLRTAQKLSVEKCDEWHDLVLELARRHGVRDVTVVVLDDCTDLTVERPRASAAMQHQARRVAPVISR